MKYGISLYLLGSLIANLYFPNKEDSWFNAANNLPKVNIMRAGKQRIGKLQ